jgi:predicted outer membrane repeat protein
LTAIELKPHQPLRLVFLKLKFNALYNVVLLIYLHLFPRFFSSFLL